MELGIKGKTALVLGGGGGLGRAISIALAGEGANVAVADIDAGYDRLSPWILPDAMFRPPHGKMTLPTYWSIRRRGAPVWWWTVDSGDTRDILPDPAQVADRVRREGGGIVLMHDLDRTQNRNDFVLELTAALLDVARQESFKVARLGEICL